MNIGKRGSSYYHWEVELSAGLDSGFSPRDARSVYQRFSSKCFRCGSTYELQIDHHMPLSRGYGLQRDNAVLLCRSCNSAKSDIHPADFYTQGELNGLAVCGIVTPPEDVPSFIDALLKLTADDALREKYGSFARAYAVSHLEQEVVLNKFNQAISQLCSGK